MLATERKEKILALLKEQKTATLEELTAITGASVSTLRRDLNELEEEHFLRRVHGGAALQQGLSEELSIFEKSSKNVQEKEKIAALAFEKIKEGDIIYLDAGTTVAPLYHLLNQSGKRVTIVTNSISHLPKLTSENLIVYLLGGRVKRQTDAIIGSSAIAQLSTYRFNLAFIGANAFDKELGAMTPDSEEAAIKAQAIHQSSTSYLLLDSSKIGQTSFVKFAESDQIKLITEKL
ncbi:DeoR family transcriptional regulator [Lactococcus garvieae]|nr:DeoR family transcriptional regulator [Lactococcus garvieae]